MNFKLTTELYCEPECIAKHAADIAVYGSKALIVTGRHSSIQNGSLDDIKSVLSSHRIEYATFNQVDENPSVENILLATWQYRDFSPDFVIGIGGGSPLDAAKAIALMLANPGSNAELLSSPTSAAYIPVIEIPTTCGTGSEVTPYSILTFHDKHTKSSIPHKIYPALALIDPMYLSSASPQLLKNTAADSLGHLIESYINTRATTISRVFSIQGLSLWKQVNTVLDKPELTYEDYELLMMTSSIAGMAISHTGTSLPHAMSYSLTYEHKVPHGKAVGTFLAEYVSHASVPDRDSVLKYLGMDNCHMLKECIQKHIGTANMTAYEIEFSTNSLLGNSRRLASCPYAVDENVLRDIYSNSVNKAAT